MCCFSPNYFLAAACERLVKLCSSVGDFVICLLSVLNFLAALACIAVLSFTRHAFETVISIFGHPQIKTLRVLIEENLVFYVFIGLMVFVSIGSCFAMAAVVTRSVRLMVVHLVFVFLLLVATGGLCGLCFEKTLLTSSTLQLVSRNYRDTYLPGGNFSDTEPLSVARVFDETMENLECCGVRGSADFATMSAWLQTRAAYQSVLPGENFNVSEVRVPTACCKLRLDESNHNLVLVDKNCYAYPSRNNSNVDLPCAEAVGARYGVAIQCGLLALTGYWLLILLISMFLVGQYRKWLAYSNHPDDLPLKSLFSNSYSEH